MPVLSDEAIVRINAAFEKADIDGKGYVTGEQIESHLNELFEEESGRSFVPHGSGEARPVIGSRLQARIDKLNTVNPGALNLTELLFVVAYLKVMLICKVLFTSVDTDGSGDLNEEEMSNVIQLMRARNGLEPATPEEIDAIIAKNVGEDKVCTYYLFERLAVPRILRACGIEMVFDDEKEETTTNHEPATTTVTKENYGLAETQVIFADYVKKIQGATGSETGTNVLLHVPKAHDPNDKAVMRVNFDTMYSFAIVDLTSPDQCATLVLPTSDEEIKRYQSALVISEEHWIPLIAEEPGSYELTKESVGTPWCMIILRTQVNMNDPNDLAIARKLQQGIELNMKLDDTVPGSPYLPTNKWDMEEILTMRAYYEEYTHKHDAITSETMFGPKGSWSLVEHNCGTAFGWGGFPKEQAVYPQIPVIDGCDDGEGQFKVTLRDVPVDAFWSVTVYDEKGYVSTKDGDVYNINSAFATPHDDEPNAYTIHFGNNFPEGTPNVMSIAKGWNVTARLYQPKSEYFDKTWTLPTMEKA